MRFPRKNKNKKNRHPYAADLPVKRNEGKETGLSFLIELRDEGRAVLCDMNPKAPDTDRMITLGTRV